MPNVIELLWLGIVEAKANFYDFLLLLNEFSVRFFESEFAVGLFGENGNFAAVAKKYAWLPYFLMGFALLEAFLGRRILKVQKLVLALIVGFSIGTVYIAPPVSAIVNIDHFIIGLAFGAVVAVFKTPLYYALVTSILMYFFYFQCMNLLNFTKFWSLAVSAFAVILILVFLMKWVELIGTSLVGGWLFSASLALVADFPPQHAVLIGRIIIFTLAALGFLVQFKYRKRKKRLIFKKKRKEAA